MSFLIWVGMYVKEILKAKKYSLEFALKDLFHRTMVRHFPSDPSVPIFKYYFGILLFI